MIWISILPAFEPGTFGSKELSATRTPSWQYNKNGIKLNIIQSRHSWWPAMPMQNNMANSPCKIGLSEALLASKPRGEQTKILKFEFASLAQCTFLKYMASTPYLYPYFRIRFTPILLTSVWKKAGWPSGLGRYLLSHAICHEMWSNSIWVFYIFLQFLEFGPNFKYKLLVSA